MFVQGQIRPQFYTQSVEKKKMYLKGNALLQGCFIIQFNLNTCYYFKYM